MESQFVPCLGIFESNPHTVYPTVSIVLWKGVINTVVLYGLTDKILQFPPAPRACFLMPQRNVLKNLGTDLPTLLLKCLILQNSVHFSRTDNKMLFLYPKKIEMLTLNGPFPGKISHPAWFLEITRSL